MQLFYTPDHARVGDVIPYYENGEFKLFYLKNWNPYFGSDKTYGWHLLTTKDLIHYESETAIGILGGTGCIIKVEGLYHLYYCVFEDQPQRQYVCHVTSTDLTNWTKYPDETFGPDESIYLLTDWRDPHVIWNEEEKCWWMILCAQNQGNTKRRGCVGLCKSADLHHWTCCEPLYAPQSSMSAYECPDLFYMNGWWYLVFSQFTDRFQTLYRMSRSCNGPWIRPKTDSFDGRAFYAAKTCSDGEHRYIFGWNPTRTQNTWNFDPDPTHEGYDYKTYDWGGSLVPHEIYAREDGTLAVRSNPALKKALTVSNEIKWIPLNGDWKVDQTSVNVDSPIAYASIISENDVPHQGCLSLDFTFTSGTERFAVVLQADQEFARGYYFYLDPKRQRIEYKSAIRMHEQGGWTFQYDVELERPVELIPNQTYSMEIFVDESVMEVYVNDEVAMSVRAYDLHDRKFGFAVSDGAVKFENVKLTTLGEL